jgi:uroporphyrinogen-III decarboxylase
MLSIKENFLETIHGGRPDRFVNQYEFLSIILGQDPIFKGAGFPAPGTEIVNAWGVTLRFKEGQPGPFPVHDGGHKVITDITRWKDVIKSPRTSYPDADWEEAKQMADAVDRNQTYVAPGYYTGVFEQLHYLMGMDDALANFYEEPEVMKELIAYITEYELHWAEEMISHLQPDALFHHDDWGSQSSSFISPEMFREFIFPAYQKIYAYYKTHGVEIIVHHSDSYAANLVPQMIELGIDVFQGCITTNNVPDLVKRYGGKIAFMGDLNNGVIDKADWTAELVRREVERACRGNGTLYYIPCLTMGGPVSTFPGVYEAVTAEINRMSREIF